MVYKGVYCTFEFLGFSLHSRLSQKKKKVKKDRKENRKYRIYDLDFEKLFMIKLLKGLMDVFSYKLLGLLIEFLDLSE